jgi:hypothetical protein
MTAPLSLALEGSARLAWSFSRTQSVAASLDFLQEQLDAVALSMQQAAARHDTADLDALKLVFRKLSAQAAALRAEVSGTEAPPVILQKLDKFSDTALDLSKRFFTGVADLPRAIDKGLGFALLAVILLAVAYVYFVYIRPAKAVAHG